MKRKPLSNYRVLFILEKEMDKSCAIRVRGLLELEYVRKSDFDALVNWISLIAEEGGVDPVISTEFARILVDGVLMGKPLHL